MRSPRKDPEELVGLTIQLVGHIEDHLVLVFADQTYTAIKSVAYGDCSVVEPVLEGLDSNPTHLSCAEQYLALEIWTPIEYAQWLRSYNQWREGRRLTQEEDERRQYERLKAKYGDPA